MYTPAYLRKLFLVLFTILKIIVNSPQHGEVTRTHSCVSGNCRCHSPSTPVYKYI